MSVEERPIVPILKTCHQPAKHRDFWGILLGNSQLPILVHLINKHIRCLQLDSFKAGWKRRLSQSVSNGQIGIVLQDGVKIKSVTLHLIIQVKRKMHLFARRAIGERAGDGKLKSEKIGAVF